MRAAGRRSGGGVVVLVAALVFALALGVILGSGPLRTAFLGEGAREAEALRAQLAERDNAVADAAAENELLARYLDELSHVAAEDRLADRTIAVVVAPGVDPDDADAMAKAFTDAGGTVVATATLTPLWLDPDQVAFRTALAEEIVADVGVATEQTAPEAVLQSALVQILAPTLGGTSEGAEPDPALPPDSTLPQEQAEVLLTVLSRAGLVELERSSAPAPDDAAPGVAEPDVVVVLTPDAPPHGEDLPFADNSAALARLASTIAGNGLPTVLAQGGRTTGDPWSAVEGIHGTSTDLSMVAHAWSAGGAIMVILAAERELIGTHALYGDPAAESLLPIR